MITPHPRSRLLLSTYAYKRVVYTSPVPCNCIPPTNGSLGSKVSPHRCMVQSAAAGSVYTDAGNSLQGQKRSVWTLFCSPPSPGRASPVPQSPSGQQVAKRHQNTLLAHRSTLKQVTTVVRGHRPSVRQAMGTQDSWRAYRPAIETR